MELLDHGQVGVAPMVEEPGFALALGVVGEALLLSTLLDGQALVLAYV